MNRSGNGKKMLRVIGIDFGTSSTYMNVKRYDLNRPTADSFNYIPVAFEHGESKGSLVSVIRENSDGTFDFGRIANEEMEGASIYRNFKMDLESPDAEKREKSRGLVSMLFKYLRSVYEQQINQLGDESDEVETNISYPVKWQEGTAAFMIRAAAEAGFENVRGMDEATAAISTVITRNFERFSSMGVFAPDRTGYLLLADMGAGTTDLALCKFSFRSEDSGAPTADSLNVEIVTNWPLSEEDPTFGGREIDEVLTGYVEKYLRSVLSDELQEMIPAMVRIGNNVKLWKENNVSVNINARKPVTTCGFVRAYPGVAGTKFPPLTRESFEKLIEEQLGDYVYLLRGCIEKACAADAAFKEHGLDLVILAGGHSSWYFARDIISGAMEGLSHPALDRVRADGNLIFQLPNPQSTVALGLDYNRLMSSFTGSKTEAVDPSWVKYLFNVKPTQEFFTKQYSDEESVDLYRDALDFTARYSFPLTEEIEQYVSVFFTNPACREVFRNKPFFADKRSDICFCARKGQASASGFAISPFGIYFESIRSSGCIPWDVFINNRIHYMGWNADKIAVGSTVLPTNRICTAMCMDYLKRLQRYLKKHI